MKKAYGKSNLSIISDYLSGNRPFVSVGYDSNLENNTHKEGEEWEDSQGNKWVLKNGARQKVPKKAKFINEQRCKCCNADVRFGSYLDDRVWPKTQFCYDCFIEEETNLKIMGVWKEFNELRDLKNEKSVLTDLRNKFEESKKWCDEHMGQPITFVEEDGSLEKWDGDIDYDKINADLVKDLDVLYKRLLELDVKINNLENIYESAKTKRIINAPRSR